MPPAHQQRSSAAPSRAHRPLHASCHSSAAAQQRSTQPRSPPAAGFNDVVEPAAPAGDAGHQVCHHPLVPAVGVCGEWRTVNCIIPCMQTVTPAGSQKYAGTSVKWPAGGLPAAAMHAGFCSRLLRPMGAIWRPPPVTQNPRTAGAAGAAGTAGAPHLASKPLLQASPPCSCCRCRCWLGPGPGPGSSASPSDAVSSVSAPGEPPTCGVQECKQARVKCGAQRCEQLALVCCELKPHH